MVLLAGCGSSPSEQARSRIASSMNGAGAVPNLVNAVAVQNYAPLYRGAGGVARSFFNVAGTSAVVRAYDEHATLVWEKDLGLGSLKSGFDLDGDGIADFALVSSAPHASCNADVLYMRMASFFSGKDGALLTSTSLADECKTLSTGAVQASVTLAENTIQYGPFAGIVSIAPRYTAQGYFLQWSAPPETFGFYTPQTAAYDLYGAKTPSVFFGGATQAFVPDTQPLHGLLITEPGSGAAQYVAATSGRFLRYAVSPLAASQLVADVPFWGAARGAGRSYGLIQHDVHGNGAHVSIVAGTSVASLYQDVVQGDASGVVTGADRWGGIERHVSIYDLASNTVAQSYVSYAHDDSNRAAYIGRVAFPASTLLPTNSSAGSSILYDVFDGTTWKIVITPPGGVAAATELAHYVAWDVVERGGEEVDVLASPIDVARSVMIPNYLDDGGTVLSWRATSYFPKHEIHVFKWTRSASSMSLVKTIPDAIPYLGVPFSSPAHVATSEAAHFQSVRVMRQSPMLVVRNKAGAIVETPYDW